MKTDQELIEEFLKSGGQVEKLDNIEFEKKYVVGSTCKKVPTLMTLKEGEEMFGEKQDREKKEKEADFSDINIDLIPEHLRKFMTKKEVK